MKVTVCATKPEDDRINFNFYSKELPESWCIGPDKKSDDLIPSVGQELLIHGHWVNDSSGTRVFFHATHIEQLPLSYA